MIRICFSFLACTCLIACLFSCEKKKTENWCDHPSRPGYENYKEISTKYPWFKVYAVTQNVYAIYEPYNWQEVISYLIVGSEKAILFDTGMGLDSIQAVVRQLTPNPVTVINSHTHFDHIGGNADFKTILGVDTAYTEEHSKGWSHESIKHEVSVAALCADKLSSVDTASHRVRPYTLSGFIHDGSIIDLGGRQIEVLQIPGHTPDCIALIDRSAGLLWTGDMYYEGPVWLFFPGTDLDAYESSMKRLAELTPNLKYLLPAHNLPLSTPNRLVEVRDGLARIRSGEMKPTAIEGDADPLSKDAVEFKFNGFSFLIRRDLLPK